MKLSIICPALLSRLKPFGIPRSLGSLLEQAAGNPEVEILALYDNRRRTIGEKMNELVGMAQGEFVAGVADDDEVSGDYVARLLLAIANHPEADVIAFDHEYWHDGELRACVYESFELDEDHNDWDAGILTRKPSNKCAVRTSIARQFRYPASNDGEDREFSRWLASQGVAEHKIDSVLYRYKYETGSERARKEHVLRG